MMDFMKYELNTNQIFTGFSVVLKKGNWLSYLIAFKKRHKKLQ